jgi:predicted metalloprotease
VTRDLASILPRAKIAGSVPREDVIAHVRDVAAWTGSAPSRPLAASLAGTTGSTGGEARIVPENSTPESTGKANAPDASDERTVMVKKGDSVATILGDLGASAEDVGPLIAMLGAFGRDGGLREGQKLRILFAPDAGRLRVVRVVLVGDSAIEAAVALSETGKYVSVAPSAFSGVLAPPPKIPDGLGQPAQQDGAQQATDQPAAPVAAVAQRVVLYEEDPADPQGKRYVGSAIWRTETVTPSPGAAPDLAVRADLEIPDRRITMTFSLRRNRDPALPASHTVEVAFNLPADFPFGGISNVPGILMKQAEQTRGAPLAGLAVKVTSGFFLVGLSAVEADMQRNLQLLKERAWFDVPIVYNNGRRAILALEKGNPGERAFEEAFKAWEQTSADLARPPSASSGVLAPSPDVAIPNPLQVAPRAAEPVALPSRPSGEAGATSDEIGNFISQILSSADVQWKQIFEQAGQSYRAPTLVMFTGTTRADACGQAQPAIGPFYCPPDNKIYLDTSFFPEIERRLNGCDAGSSACKFAQAYVIAHEIGHHVQNQLGILSKVQQQQRGLAKAEANRLQVRVELQADCFAGLWAARADKQWQLIQPSDVEAAMRTAAAIGDDRLQKQTQGYVVPDSFTHGSWEQRQRWFQAGLKSGTVAACNTFAPGAQAADPSQADRTGAGETPAASLRGGSAIAESSKAMKYENMKPGTPPDAAEPPPHTAYLLTRGVAIERGCKARFHGLASEELRSAADCAKDDAAINEPKRVKTVTIRPDLDPTSATPAGTYVQVSAQKSEAEAQSSYRAMQQKYPGMLGSREASIRRADLGQAGIWYRAQIGPFTTAEQATAFCDNLKAAGGQCMVHRNDVQTETVKPSERKAAEPRRASVERPSSKPALASRQAKPRGSGGRCFVVGGRSFCE